MYIHTLIKINYIRQGYLPNYPYHLISDEEMFEVFIKTGGFFDSTYPCPDTHMIEEYNNLRSAIAWHIDQYREDSTYIIPDWVYSYVLGKVTAQSSNLQDKMYLLDLLNTPNINGDLTERTYQTCYEISKEWVNKLPSAKSNHRPPTIFGEPHVIKSLRLQNVDVLS